MDQKTLDKLNQLHPKLRQTAIACYNQAVQQTPVGVHPIIIETWRSFEESDHLYELGRTKVNPDGKSPKKPFGNIVTKARAGSSWHNYGLAIDFGLMRNGKQVYENDPCWMQVIKIFEAAGFNSGLYFPKDIIDPDHLECKMGQTISSLFSKYKMKDFIPGTTYVNF